MAHVFRALTADGGDDEMTKSARAIERLLSDVPASEQADVSALISAVVKGLEAPQ